MQQKTKSRRQLWTGFVQSCELHPEHPAVAVGREVTYRELAERAKSLAATIQEVLSTEEFPLTAVLVHRSDTAYAAVLGALMAGRGYVPLNRTLPQERTKFMPLFTARDSMMEVQTAWEGHSFC